MKCKTCNSKLDNEATWWNAYGYCCPACLIYVICKKLEIKRLDEEAKNPNKN